MQYGEQRIVDVVVVYCCLLTCIFFLFRIIIIIITLVVNMFTFSLLALRRKNNEWTRMGSWVHSLRFLFHWSVFSSQFGSKCVLVTNDPVRQTIDDVSDGNFSGTFVI